MKVKSNVQAGLTLFSPPISTIVNFLFAFLHTTLTFVNNTLAQL